MTPHRSNLHVDPGQRGAAMMMVATILCALMGGGGITLYLQMQSTKGAGMVKASRTSLYCAEAGLAESRATIAAEYLDWSAVLDGQSDNDPSWYPLRGDIDGDGEADYEVTIRDNDDEVPPAADNFLADSDRRVFAVSRCLKSAEVSGQVQELVVVAGGGHVYRNQGGGGAFNAGNVNQ